MMPPTEIKNVTVVKANREVLREANPNLVLFKPHCSLRNKTGSKVHFDTQGKPPRPQSAVTYQQYERQYTPAPPKQKRRPKSATTYSPPVFVAPEKKQRPWSANTTSTDLSNVSDIISELSKKLYDVELVEPKQKKRIWRPAKKSEGITHTKVPPPPIRSKWSNDRTKADPPNEPDKRRQNDLAWVRGYKYKSNFHSFGRFRRSDISLLCRRGVPDFHKRFPVYGHSAAKQHCCYKPMKSLTTVDHHHRVGSGSLPHPKGELETRNISSSKTHTNKRSQVTELIVDNEEVDRKSDVDEDDVDYEKNGTFSFVHQEGSVKDLDKSDEFHSVQDGDEDENTGYTTDRSGKEIDEKDEDLYFLSSNQKQVDKNSNNNKAKDITLSEVDEDLAGTYDLSKKDTNLITSHDNESDNDNTYDVSDVDDELYDDIPEIPSDIEDALAKFEKKKTNRPMSANKYNKRRGSIATSDTEAKAVESEAD